MFGLTTEKKLREAEEKVEEMKDRLGQLEHERDALLEGVESATGSLPELPERFGQVQRLQEPHVAYKATVHGLVTAVVPKDAEVVYPTKDAQAQETFAHDKLRVSQLIPVKIEELADQRHRKVRKHDRNSGHISDFTYSVGTMQRPYESLDPDIRTVCSQGLHVFRTEHAAKMWYHRGI